MDKRYLDSAFVEKEEDREVKEFGFPEAFTVITIIGVMSAILTFWL